MLLTFDDVISSHRGQRCIVLGHGPSLNDHIDKLQAYKDQGYILIGCNTWNEFYPECAPQYWVNVNNQDHSQNLMPIINKHKPIWVYADSVDLTSKRWIDTHIEGDYLPYDQRHYNSKKCGSCRGGCVNFIPNRLTIQEELQKISGVKPHYGGGHTVALHMLTLGILLGCSEVYAVGIDLNYRLGYAKNTVNRTPLRGDLNYYDKENYGSDIFKDLNIINDSAKSVGTKIYNANVDSEWDLFETKELKL